MRNNKSLLFLATSLLIAVNTEWAVPSKVLVILSAVSLFVSAIKELHE